MAIIINHRFIDRLTSTENMGKVNIVVVGTFNPGLPKSADLNSTEKHQFEMIENSEKFKKFNQVKNFYDRPQNRFWKVMDYVNDPFFYSQHSIESKNLDGLKFYLGMNRENVFKKQLNFCRQKGILLTDIVKTINPMSFNGIYDNFPDTAIEKATPIWNTGEIIEVVREHNPNKILINFSAKSKSTPNICSEISKIERAFSDKIISSLKSTSGAAGFTYGELIENWAGHFASTSHQ